MNKLLEDFNTLEDKDRYPLVEFIVHNIKYSEFDQDSEGRSFRQDFFTKDKNKAIAALFNDLEIYLKSFYRVPRNLTYSYKHGNISDIGEYFIYHFK